MNSQSISLARDVSRSVREELRFATRSDHEALHAHPVFSRLLEPNLTKNALHAANQANLYVFLGIEASRRALSVWQDLSLASKIAALKADIGELPCTAAAALRLDSSAAVLGGLYVAHGSGFGARVLGKAIRGSLPDAAISYYEFAEPLVWKHLCTHLENLQEEEVAVAIDGANQVFRSFLNLNASSLV